MLGLIREIGNNEIAWMSNDLNNTYTWTNIDQKLVRLEVDTPVFLHEDVELECHYRLNNKRLYSIKWYKDDQEFFQYMPHEVPQVRFFASKGVRLEMPAYSINNDTFRLWLHSVTLDSQGIYRCEMSTDAPDFIISNDHKTLEVYVLPSKSPRITGSRASFLIKSRVDLNCTSPKSKPVSTLQWFINDKLAPSDYQIAYGQVNQSDGLQTKTVRLKFVVNEDHFKYGNMKLKCVAIYKKLSFNGNETNTTIRRHSKLWTNRTPQNKQNIDRDIAKSDVDSSSNVSSNAHPIGVLLVAIGAFVINGRHT